MKRGPIKKKSKGKRKKATKGKRWWEKKADGIFAVMVKERANWKCQLCGRDHSENKRNLHTHHIFSRRYKNTRHDMDNGIALCGMRCHKLIAHEKPEEFRDFLLDFLGDRYVILKNKAMTVCNNYDPEGWINEKGG
jgi:hypothetical protein